MRDLIQFAGPTFGVLLSLALLAAAADPGARWRSSPATPATIASPAWRAAFTLSLPDSRSDGRPWASDMAASRPNRSVKLWQISNYWKYHENWALREHGLCAETGLIRCSNEGVL